MVNAASALHGWAIRYHGPAKTTCMKRGNSKTDLVDARAYIQMCKCRTHVIKRRAWTAIKADEPTSSPWLTSAPIPCRPLWPPVYRGLLIAHGAPTTDLSPIFPDTQQRWDRQTDRQTDRQSRARDHRWHRSGRRQTRAAHGRQTALRRSYITCIAYTWKLAPCRHSLNN